MTRGLRKQIAAETVAILERGEYPLPDGRTASIADPLAACLDATRYFSPKELTRLKYELPTIADDTPDAVIEVVNETTLAGTKRYVNEGTVTALNFASAKHAGGGFLNGAEAQEESLARASGLYASQMRATDFYRRHHTQDSYLYSHAMILSPACPVIRDGNDALLSVPYPVTFVTCAAPNAGAAADNRPAELEQLPDVFRERCDLVLALSAWHGTDTLVLGAWGCGVFRNDPEMVAGLFAELLTPGGWWRKRFRRVVFSVFDRMADQARFAAFRDAFEIPAPSSPSAS